jgi:hypothetical protein
VPSRLLAVCGAAENNEEASHWLPRLQKKARNSLAVLLCTYIREKIKSSLFLSIYLLFYIMPCTSIERFLNSLDIFCKTDFREIDFRCCMHDLK